MRIKLSPQLNTGIRVSYTFSGETITAKMKGEKDIFDFTGTPEGLIEPKDTSLPFHPIVKAERVNGVLQIELLNFISSDSPDDEKFPVWKEV